MSSKRLAANEALFRDVNERVQALRERSGLTDGDSLEEFLCECADEACLERIWLTRSEYRHVRSRPSQFAVVPGHTVARVERVVQEDERFMLVAKLP